jgi:tetratricopeptide (TPR) repeat protein
VSVSEEGKSAQRPRDPAASDHYAQALGYLRRYDNEASVDGAIRLLEGLISSEGGTARLHAGLVRAYLHKREHDEQRIWESRAATACERALELGADQPEVRLALGEIQLATGRAREAMVSFQEAQRGRPESVEALLGMGRSHLACGEVEQAEDALRQATVRWPDDWRSHSLLGWTRFRTGRNELALESWRRVVEITPDNARGRLNLGNALYRLDRFEEAIEAYRQSLAIRPYTHAYTSLGTALYHLGRNEECLSAFRKATELTPADPIMWGNLGNAFHWIPGHQDEAALALDRAIELMRERLHTNPNVADSWARLAGWLANRGDGPGAVSSIRKALELAPNDSSCMAQAGHVYFKLGDRKECLRWLKEALNAGYGAGSLLGSRELAPLHDDPEFRKLIDEGATSTRKQNEVRSEGGRA